MSRLGVAGLVDVTAVLHGPRVGPDGQVLRDDRGNVVRGTARTVVKGCSWQQPASSESVSEDRNQATDTSTLIAPWWPEIPDGFLSQAELDGQRWSIEGNPRRHRHPRIGHVTLTLREVHG